MSQKVPWIRVVVEGVVVVASILLAFSIDRGWDKYRTRQVEAEALEVLARDLRAAVSQLEVFREHQDGTAAASFEAYQALSLGVERSDQAGVSARIRRAFRRRTLSLPRTGYAELMSSGSLNAVRRPALREAIIGHYDLVSRTEAAVEKNSTTFTDGFMGSVFTVGGLLLRVPEPADDVNTVLGDRSGNRLPPDFAHRPDPLWRYAVDSPEWDRARSVLLQNGRGAQANVNSAQELIAAAEALHGEIRAYLDGD